MPPPTTKDIVSVAGDDKLVLTHAPEQHVERVSISKEFYYPDINCSPDCCHSVVTLSDFANARINVKHFFTPPPRHPKVITQGR